MTRFITPDEILLNIPNKVMDPHAWLTPLIDDEMVPKD